jgi:hypothetical protein
MVSRQIAELPRMTSLRSGNEQLGFSYVSGYERVSREVKISFTPRCRH